jgi:hypothetical protein
MREATLPSHRGRRDLLALRGTRHSLIRQFALSSHKGRQILLTGWLCSADPGSMRGPTLCSDLLRTCRDVGAWVRSGDTRTCAIAAGCVRQLRDLSADARASPRARIDLARAAQRRAALALYKLCARHPEAPNNREPRTNSPPGPQASCVQSLASFRPDEPRWCWAEPGLITHRRAGLVCQADPFDRLSDYRKNAHLP